jgi:hypothetical protein
MLRRRGWQCGWVWTATLQLCSPGSELEPTLPTFPMCMLKLSCHNAVNTRVFILLPWHQKTGVDGLLVRAFMLLMSWSVVCVCCE